MTPLFTDTPSSLMADTLQTFPADAFTSWQHQHLIDSSHLEKGDVLTLLRLASELGSSVFKAGKPKLRPLLTGKTVATVFYENSTRTRCSFELAAKYLGAHTVDLSVAASSVNKGETLYDTVDSLIAMGVDALVLRHGGSGIHHQVARHVGSHLTLLNAGDGQHDHPTQGLLDLYTLLNALGSLEDKIITLVGDVRHSRVARSNLALLPLFGAQVRLVGPPSLLPDETQGWPVAMVTDSLEEALDGAHAVMALRLQKERMDSGLVASLGSYARGYQITSERLKAHCAEGVRLLHPGPMNREVEVSSEVADNPQVSLIRQQVRHGVLVRMAALVLVLGVDTNTPF
jgi:aspartate carbamoyltransferase catalytic subunit